MFQKDQQIGTYTLVKSIGRGDNSEIWLAERQAEESLTTQVIVRLPYPEKSDVDDIRVEIGLWRQVNEHPNIVPIIEAKIYDGQIVIASEYSEEVSLADKLQTQGKFAPQQAIKMMIGVLDGLEALHSQGVVHRHLTPQNILLRNETPSLASFGILEDIDVRRNNISYLAPELLYDASPEELKKVYSVQTDIWSAGVILYRLLSGVLPFRDNQVFEILTARYERLPYKTHPALREVVRLALAEKLEHRYQSAGAMREDLEKALADVQNLERKGREVFDIPSFSEASYPEAKEIRGIIPHGAWGVGGDRDVFFATSDSYETVIAFYEGRFGKGELNSKSGAVTWKFEIAPEHDIATSIFDISAINTEPSTISVFPESAFGLFSDIADVRRVYKEAKAIITIYPSHSHQWGR